MESQRITSIDALRGLTIAFMILVNDPGDWSHVYAPLDHAEWNGFTPTDLVFPTFLFLAGCAIVFSVESRIAKGISRGKIALQILRRSTTIFLIGLFLASYPEFHLTQLRIYGVLARIALCYLAAGLLFLYVRSARALAAIAVAILVGYWLLLRFVPIPGLGVPVRDFPILDPERNLTAWIDRGVTAWTQRWLHTGRLYEQTRDPEGLLSTIPAVASTLLGVLAALHLRVPHSLPRGGVSKLRRGIPVFAAGLISLALGTLWNPSFPINKNLWTSSYVLFAGGWSLLLLAVFFWLLDVKRIQQRSRTARALLWPLLVYGSNAITAYVVSEFVVDSLYMLKLPDASGPARTAWGWIYFTFFARHGSTENTSLAFGLAFVAFCFLPNWLLWRRKIFLRV